MNKNDNNQIQQTSWKTFLWNSDTKEFLGRSGKSWFLITVFYIFFFAFLGCFFSLTVWVLLKTLEGPLPRYQDRVGSPGFVILPKADSFHIEFSSDKPTSYESHVKELRTFLQGNKYSNTTGNETCVPGVYRDQQPLDQTPMTTGESKLVPPACPFSSDLLGPCSGIDDPTFGYGSSNPCILIKMNKIIGFKPGTTVQPAEVSCSGKGIKHTGYWRTDVRAGIASLVTTWSGVRSSRLDEVRSEGRTPAQVGRAATQADNFSSGLQQQGQLMVQQEAGSCQREVFNSTSNPAKPNFSHQFPCSIQSLQNQEHQNGFAMFYQVFG
uniref:sodium/potassium-transporting ATPase subunit beta-3-like n=1 Tax=Myxine glutinosa TaxID=7769 RepID=UPI00358E048F